MTSKSKNIPEEESEIVEKKLNGFFSRSPFRNPKYLLSDPNVESCSELPHDYLLYGGL